MNRKIYILAAASFATGTEAYVFSGHLSALAADLNQSVGAAGQLATAFALTYAVAAPFIARAVSGFGRRDVIVAGLVLIGLLNIAATFAPSLYVLIGLRIACGLAAGLVGPMSSVAAAELAPEGQRGKALAIVLGGMTLALLLGIPIGSVVGDIAGWRGTFVFAGGVALIAALAVRLVLPEMTGTAPASRSSAFRTALDPKVALWLGLTLVGFAATFTAIAYVGPIVTAISGLEGSGIGAVQAMIGVGSIIGVVIGARVADRPGAHRAMVASFLVSAAALATYSALMLMVAPSIPMSGAGHLFVIGVLCVGMMAGAAALFMRTPVIQTWLAAASPAAARPVILALNGSMVFAGQGLGAAIGGAAIGLAGLSSVGLVAAAVALLGAGLAVRLRRRPAPANASAG